MPRNHVHLTPQDRAVVMLMRDDQCSIRSIAKRLCRSASTIRRELKRADAAGVYDANHAQNQALALRVKRRKFPKLTVSHETIYNTIYLHPRGELKRERIACLRHHNSPRYTQIAG